MRDLALVAALFAATAEAQVYSMTDFGRQCGGDLTGQVVQTPQDVSMRLGVSNAIPSAVAVLVLGSRAPAPIALLVTAAPVSPIIARVSNRPSVNGSTMQSPSISRMLTIVALTPQKLGTVMAVFAVLSYTMRRIVAGKPLLAVVSITM